jgi:hypothetical protein
MILPGPLKGRLAYTTHFVLYSMENYQIHINEKTLPAIKKQPAIVSWTKLIPRFLHLARPVPFGFRGKNHPRFAAVFFPRKPCPAEARNYFLPMKQQLL